MVQRASYFTCDFSKCCCFKVYPFPYFRSLLLPKPLKEIRVKGQYDEFKEIPAAQGVKIAARDLEKAIAGLNLQVAYHEDEVDLLKEEVDKEFKNAMRSIKVQFYVSGINVRRCFVACFYHWKMYNGGNWGTSFDLFGL